MSISILTRSFGAAAVMAAHSIAAFAAPAADSSVEPATGPADPLLGTTGTIGASAAGAMVDLDLAGIGTVQLGGAVEAGDWLTSDANSKAVATTTLGHNVIGKALQPGAADEIIDYHIAPGVIGETA